LYFTPYINMGFEPTQGRGESRVALDNVAPPACFGLGLQAFDASSNLAGKRPQYKKCRGNEEYGDKNHSEPSR
jgi:hypothetical protein